MYRNLFSFYDKPKKEGKEKTKRNIFNARILNDNNGLAQLNRQKFILSRRSIYFCRY